VGDLPRLGDDADLQAIRARGVRAAVVAVGDNERREALFREVQRLGFELPNAVHPAATVDPSARLGRGLAIMAGAVINPGAVLADNVIINTGATIDHDCHIERGAHLAPGVHLSGYVTVGAGALIGIGAVVGRGRPLRGGDRAIVGAGAVVLQDVEPDATVVGVPARPLATAPRRRPRAFP
jgi:UDP-perosamine 4-acetyltransferase